METQTQTSELLQEELTPEEAKASLGLSTRLSEQMLMAQVPKEGVEGSETPETAPGEEETPEQQETPPLDPEAFKSEIMDEVKSAIKEEIEGLKEMLKGALEEDDEEETGKTEKDTE